MAEEKRTGYRQGDAPAHVHRRIISCQVTSIAVCCRAHCATRSNARTVEDALYVEKERAQVTLNSIGDAVLCTDISGNIGYLNLVAETMTGWTREEAIGRPLAEVFQIVDGATRKPARDPLEMDVEQNRTVGLTVNCVLIRRDGFESAIEDSAAPINDRAGRVIGAVIVFHDVTAAQAMSAQMTHSAQQVGAIRWLIDLWL